MKTQHLPLTCAALLAVLASVSASVHAEDADKQAPPAATSASDDWAVKFCDWLESSIHRCVVDLLAVPGEGEPNTSTPTENEKETEPMPPLTSAERRIILQKGTERPFTGKYWDHFEAGTYSCRQCGTELYRSDSKFSSNCGWPSFDDEVPGAVKRKRDADGRRTEILCAACDGHLGHVFEGERLTKKNVRHCVNSRSLVFRPAEKAPDKVAAKPATEEAIFAGGCFWGVEHHFEQVDGVISATSGYTGGRVKNPTYRQICTGRTGHAEAVRVVFDPSKTSYEELSRLFFEIHDPTQLNRQGPDVGTQYRSVVFYKDDEQKRIGTQLITRLRNNGYSVVTQLLPASEFYEAEEYHQDYMEKNPNRPTCHVRVRRFDRPKP